MSRAEFLRRAMALLPATLWLRPADLWAQQPDAALRARVAAVIAAYDGQGFHRTGTDVDTQSARWLAAEASGAGADARLEPFSLDRVDVRSAVVRGPGQTIEGLPFFDGSFTDARGVTGRLGAPGSPAEIALVRIDQAGISSEGQSIAELRRSTSHHAVVAVTHGAAPGLSPSNAASFAKPYGLPVLQIGSEHQTALDALAGSATAVTVVVHAERTRASAQNVVASIAGSQPSLPPLIVMTPRSGWWHCASERGGGLACWLECMRAVAKASPARSVMFVASSGHELGHYGLDRFIDARPGLIRQAAAWMHLGANIGARNGAARLQARDDEIEKLALEAVEQSGGSFRQRVPRGTVPGGEARNIHVGGGRYVSVLGSSPMFHNIDDRWPAAVDVDAVATFASAVASVAVSLARP